MNHSHNGPANVVVSKRYNRSSLISPLFFWLCVCCCVCVCSGLSLEPIYEYVNNRMLLSGYRGTNSITFRVEIPFAGEVVDGIVQRGVTRIDGISFVASPKEINQARHLAIQAAVEDAINQAMVTQRE